MTTPVRLDIFSDIACPWCFLGKRRLEAGLELFRRDHPDVDVEITYRSYQLAPETPVEVEESQASYVARTKGIPAEQMEQMQAQLTAVAAAEGVEYHFDRVRHTNTLLAHQLLHFAKAHGRQTELKDRLMQAHFTEGRHVGRVDDLVELAVEVGLDADEARSALESEQYLPDVQADQSQAQALGIRGVPFFVIDRRFGLSGAQPAETFAEALSTAVAQR